MLSFVIMITVAIIFAIPCSILLGALNKSRLRLFVPIQRMTNKLKRKRLYSNLTMVILIIIGAGLRAHYNLSDIKYGLLLGFFFALQDAIFDNLIGDKR